MIAHVFNKDVFLLAILGVFVLIFLAPVLVRRLFGRRAPATGRVAEGWTSRIAEAIMRAALAAFFLIILSWSPLGKLAEIDELRPQLARLYIIFASVYVAIAILAIAVTLLGRSFVGGWIMVINILAYMWIMSSPLTIDRLAPQPAPGELAPQVNYTLKATDDALEGVDLWVNEVYLGKMPVTMKMAEFLEKVPFMEEPPEGYKKGDDEPEGHWFEFRPPDVPTPSGMGDHNYSQRKYYVRAKLADEFSDVAVGSSAHLEGKFKGVAHYSCTSRLQIKFSSRQQRFEMLLVRARLADYQVGDEWFEVISTYGRQGWDKVWDLARKEKGFEQILDDWARWKYGFEKDISPAAAQKAFDRFCEEIDKSGAYNSDTVAGRAVEVLFDKLDVNKLVRRYVRIVKAEGKVQPTWTRRENVNVGGFVTRPMGDAPQAPSISILEHALVLWDEKLDAQGNANIVEEKVAPVLVCYSNHIDLAYKIGGSAIEKFVQRKYREQPGDRAYLSRLTGSYNPVGHLYSRARSTNPWLYLSANLDSEAGRQFRTENYGPVIEMAKELIRFEKSFMDRPPKFLFLDNELGAESIAAKFWPEYRDRAEGEYAEVVTLYAKWRYLAKMGDLATVDMFIEAWKQAGHERDIVQRTRQGLPVDKRRQLIRRLIEELEKRAVELGATGSEKNVREARWIRHSNIPELWFELAGLNDEKAIEFVIAYEQNPDPKKRSFRLKGDWVLKEDFVEKLPPQQSRVMKLHAVDIWKKYPTSKNRRLFAKLLNDADEKVRGKARQVAVELKVIEQTHLAELVSVPATVEVNE